MQTPLTSSETRWLRASAAFIVCLSVVALIGQLLDSARLVALLPGNTLISVHAICCDFFAAGALAFLSWRQRSLAAACGVIVTLVGAYAFADRLFGHPVTPDPLVWLRWMGVHIFHPGRMSLTSALGLTLGGVALTYRSVGRGSRWPIAGLAGIVGALALLPFLQYLAWAVAGPTPVTYQGMSLAGAACLLVLSAALLRSVHPGPRGGERALPFMAAALGMLFAVGIAAVQANSSLLAVNREVTLGYRIRGAIDHLVEQVAREESSARGYALTGEVLFRDREVVHQNEVLQDLAALEPLLDADPTQAARLARVRSLALEKFAQSADLQHLRESGGAAGAAEYLKQLLAEPGQPTSNLVDETDQIQRTETSWLQTRVAVQAEVERNTRIVQTAGSLFALIFLGFAAAALRRASAARAAAEAEAARRTAELAASEAHFRSAFEDAGIGMAIVGLDGRWVRLNNGICDLLGYSDAELRRKTFQDVTHPDDLAIDLERVQDLIAGRMRTYQLEKRYFHRSGRIIWVNLTVSLVHDSAGAPLHFISQIQDVTARKRLETELRVARDEALATARFKSEFLATMSHEIRTPMNGVLGMATLLAQTELSEPQKEMSSVILSSAESLLALIDDILDLSKMEAGKLRIQPGEFDLRGLILEVLTLLGPRARQKGLTLHSDLPADLTGEFVGDASRIRQVLTNLVGNAIKFTEHGGIVVRAEMRRESADVASVRMSVIDTGVGIPGDAHGRLFQPFNQVDGSISRKFGGSGLGLAICRQLVTLMGGEIGFTSEPGAGSTFWFEVSLPRRRTGAADPAPAAAAPAGVPAPAPAWTPGPALRLLVVEDNRANQLVARMMLTSMGYSVEIAATGQAAIDLVEQETFSGVLMDCQMPEMDGYETTRRIRAAEARTGRRRLPIIALTAHAFPEDREKSFASGMDDHLCKPLRTGELREALERRGLLGSPAATGPARAGGDAASILDAEIVASLRELPGESGGSLWPEIIGMFLREKIVRMPQMLEFAATRKGEQLAAAAHGFAGSCGSIGAMQLQTAAKNLERDAFQSDWPAVAVSLRALRAALDNFHRALASDPAARL